MAPEQWEGLGNADARSDVYSLGVILFEALSGRLPLEADGTLAWLNKHRYEAPRDLREAMAGRSIPEGMRRAVMRAMAKNPGERQQTAMELSNELATALEAAVAGEEDAPPRPARRWRFAYTALALAIAGAATLAFVWPGAGGPSPEPVPRRARPPGLPVPARDSYFPMKVGNWWIYNVTVKGDRTTQKTIKFDREGDVGGANAGLQGFRLDRREPAGAAYRWFARQGSAIGFVHDEWFDLSGQLTRDVSFKPFRFRVDDAGEHSLKGAKWTEIYQRIEYEEGKPARSKELSEEWTVEEVGEEITVPAGKFSCIRLYRRSLIPGVFEDSRYWFARGVGKVREDSIDELERLVEYRIEK